MRVVGRLLIGLGALVAVVVVAFVAILAWAIATGEEQSHDRAAEVGATYRATAIGARESTVRRRLGEPSLVAAGRIRRRPARCSIYRVLLSSSELVPYRFCFVAKRLASKSRSWKNVPRE